MKQSVSLLNILTFLMLAFGGASCSDTSGSKDDATPDMKAFHSDLYRELTRTDRMVFASMSVTKTAVTDDSKLWGKRIGVYSYDTYLRASVDMSRFSPDDLIFDDDAHTVTVTLPPVEVDLSGRDMTLREEYTNIGLLRSRFGSAERAKAKEAANKDFKKELARNDSFKKIITERAQNKARDYFRSFFESNGYEATINFK
ncbi:MAG: DUF4230 domain-containing protein [Muribaculaceae bacterium]|nr:DUF4230 domain-containing protein [Muribaculaceae bacterium]